VTSVICQAESRNSWYAIYVKSRQEKCVHDKLQNKGIKSSLPLQTVYRQWSDRKKKVEVPLFRGYIFVNIDIQNEKLDVLQTDGVVKFVTFGNRTINIPGEQMYWLNRLLTTSNIKHEQEFPIGADVEVTYGPLKGLYGKVKQKKSETRLVVWFDAIMQGISVDISSIYMMPRNKIKTYMSPGLRHEKNIKSVKAGSI